MTSSNLIPSLIVEQLGGGEKRMLSLIVAVRKARGRSGIVKGDLSVGVKLAVRKLVASGTVVDVDGVYSLSSRK